MCAMPEIIGLSPLRGSSVYRAWNPRASRHRANDLAPLRGCFVPRFGHRASRPRKWIYSNGHSLPGAVLTKLCMSRRLMRKEGAYLIKSQTTRPVRHPGLIT